MASLKSKRVLLAALFILLISIPTEAEILAVRIDGVINPPTASYVLRALEEAEKRGIPLLIEIDTPGGLLASTQEMVTRILNSRVPVITWVHPAGARAASAGLFLLESGHVAVMSPGTHAGAAHPVALGKGMDKHMAEKIANDTVAFLKNIAQQRGRYAPILDDMILKSKVLTEEEMLKEGLIDFIAPDAKALLKELSKRRIFIKGRTFTFSEQERIRWLKPGFKERLFQVLSHPTIAYLLLVLGFYGLLFELSNPGLIFPGVVGVIFLVLGFYSLHILPLNYAGFALIVFSFLLFILEVKIQSHGLLGAGGVFSFLLGSMMLFDKLPDVMKPSWATILAVTVVTGCFFLFVVVAAYKALRKPPVSGAEGLVGEVGVVKTALKPGSVGWVFVHGEMWKAVSDQEISEGEQIEVVGVRGLTLKVRRISHDSA